MIEVWRGAARYPGGEPAAGIETRHAFSFAGHYDPENVGFGLLRACNEELLAPGAGFAEHAHRDVEIVTWVIEGELEHRHGAGPTAKLGPGELQRLRAGSGVRHTERNAGGTPLRFLQMWLHPDSFGGAPEYAVVTPPAGPGLRLLVSGPAEASLYVAQDSCELPTAPFLYVHAVRGRVRLGDAVLEAGDAARITGEPAGLRAEVEGPAEFLVWEMHAEPKYG